MSRFPSRIGYEKPLLPLHAKGRHDRQANCRRLAGYWREEDWQLDRLHALGQCSRQAIVSKSSAGSRVSRRGSKLRLCDCGPAGRSHTQRLVETVITPNRLNLGCGSDIREGWINADCRKLPGVEIVFDAAKDEWPFADSVLTHILASHFLEHILRGAPMLHVFEEAWRALMPGGRFDIIVPSWDNPKAQWGDPTHISPIHPHLFSYFHPSESPFRYSTASFILVGGKVSKYVATSSKGMKIGNSGLSWREHLVARGITLPLIATAYERSFILQKV